LRIAVAADHAAFREKDAVARFLRDAGHEILDFGTHGEDSVDYPDVARPAAEAVGRGEADRAVLVCGSGVGQCMVANKVRGVRAVLLANPYVTEMSRRHNDSNAACLGARWQDVETMKHLLRVWLSTPFEAGRHLLRVQKLDAMSPGDPPGSCG
jgi:ribose 5-phosphate isomerase B